MAIVPAFRDLYHPGNFAIAAETFAQAEALWEFFDRRSFAAVERRIALAIDEDRADDAMFWLEVQTGLYQREQSEAGRVTIGIGPKPQPEKEPPPDEADRTAESRD